MEMGMLPAALSDLRVININVPRIDATGYNILRSRLFSVVIFNPIRPY